MNPPRSPALKCASGFSGVVRGGLAAAVLLVLGLGGAAAGTPSASDLPRVTAQFREFYLGPENAFEMRDSAEPPPDPASSRRFAATLREDGSWPDVNYAGDARSGWPPAVHYTRMTALATTAMGEGLAPAERTQLLAATHRAFRWWIAHDYRCPNWWYEEIGTPKTIGLCALLLGDELAPDERDYVTKTLLPRSSIRPTPENKIKLTGQNKVWLAGNTLMRALLEHDDALVDEAATAIWEEVIVTTGEGIQPDHSFHQHGAQQQFGNYGVGFAVETARWGRILRDTRWQLPVEKREILRGYLLEGQGWVSWRGAMDISACNRQLMPRTPRTKTATLARVMRQAAIFDPEKAGDYERFVARNRPGAANDLVGHRFFWRSDYFIHRRPGFMATLKLSSHRVIGNELVNNENLSGYHTGDGCLYVYGRGDEYEEIFPVWDWCKLPGVTCALRPELPRVRNTFVDRDFVGGISDGVDAVAVLDYVRDGVQAKKAWFFGGDGVVCLGADIAGPAASPVVTTLNQCLLRGPVTVQAGERRETLAAGRHSLTQVSAVEHDGWRYTLLDGGRLEVELGPVTGNWHRVFDNPDSPAADVTRELFTAWIDHGKEASQASYAYAVTPAGATPAFELLENSAGVQAVRMTAAKTGVVFWRAGSIQLPDSRRLQADQTCVVLLTTEATLVADPTQQLQEIRLTLDGVECRVQLPQGERAGTAVPVK